jgi:acyl carrier protein
MIAEKVRAALGRELKRDPATIEMHHLLREDLGLNSLDAIELMFKVEEEFDLEIPDADLQKLKTVGDLVAYLESRLERTGPVPPPAPPAIAAGSPGPVPAATPRPAAAARPARASRAGPSPRASRAGLSPRASSAAPKRTGKRRSP